MRWAPKINAGIITTRTHQMRVASRERAFGYAILWTIKWNSHSNGCNAIKYWFRFDSNACGMHDRHSTIIPFTFRIFFVRVSLTFRFCWSDATLFAAFRNAWAEPKVDIFINDALRRNSFLKTHTHGLNRFFSPVIPSSGNERWRQRHTMQLSKPNSI